MRGLPNECAVVRTAFTVHSDQAWEQLCAALLTENADGFRAYVSFVDDPAWNGATAAEVIEHAASANVNALVMFVADGPALDERNGFPLLVAELGGASDGRTFRCVASELWSVENNLNLGNMDWEDFADALDPDGVFRGFPPWLPEQAAPEALAETKPEDGREQ